MAAASFARFNAESIAAENARRYALWVFIRLRLIEQSRDPWAEVSARRWLVKL